MSKSCMLSHDCCYGHWAQPHTCAYHYEEKEDHDICPREVEKFETFFNTLVSEIHLIEDILEVKK